MISQCINTVQASCSKCGMMMIAASLTDMQDHMFECDWTVKEVNGVWDIVCKECGRN